MKDPGHADVVSRQGCHRRIACWLSVAVLALSLALPVGAASRIEGDLPRVGNRALESLPGVDTVFGELRAPDGARLRTITTAPADMKSPLPAILFVQWLSCDSIEIAAKAQDGWARMLRRLVTESGALVMRTDKAGVGDSQGPACAALDYDTELAQHRAALETLRQNPHVDRERIVIFGASMGATFAPLIAEGQKIRGVAVWGGGARTWFERMLAFDRRAMELFGKDPAGIAPAMMRHAEFQFDYLVRGLTPDEIAARAPRLGNVWKEIVGTDGVLHYGRPLAFHQQAQRHDWAAAWARVDVPVLAMLGEYDWFEEPRSAELIARIVNRRQPGSGEFHLVPRMDHHFTLYASPEAAFAEKGGEPNPDQALATLLPWLKRVMR